MVEVTRSGGDATAAHMSYSTSNGTGSGAANAGKHYTKSTGTLDFADGQTMTTFSVPILGDGKNDREPYPVFDLALSNATGGAKIDSTDGTAQVWVHDVEMTDINDDLY